MKKTKPKKQTRAGLAAKLGLSRSTLHDWKSKGCPVDDGETAVLSWAMANSRKGLEPDDIRAAKLQVLTETARRLKLANDAKEDRSIQKSDVQSVVTKGMAELFSAMDRKFSLELPPALKGLDESEIQKHLLAAIHTFKAGLRAQWAAMIEP